MRSLKEGFRKAVVSKHQTVKTCLPPFDFQGSLSILYKQTSWCENSAFDSECNQDQAENEYTKYTKFLSSLNENNSFYQLFKKFKTWLAGYLMATAKGLNDQAK